MEKLVIYLLNQNIKLDRIKQLNFEFKTAKEKRTLDLNLLAEWRNEAYESARMFKEKVKIWHEKKIKKKEFKVGDQVLLYNSRFKFSAGKPRKEKLHTIQI